MKSSSFGVMSKGCSRGVGFVFPSERRSLIISTATIARIRENQNEQMRSLVESAVETEDKSSEFKPEGEAFTKHQDATSLPAGTHGGNRLLDRSDPGFEAA